MQSFPGVPRTSLFLSMMFAAALTATSAMAADVAVYRGAAEGPPADHEVQTTFGVTEIRGTIATPVVSKATSPAEAVYQPIVVGGSRLWIYDRGAGTVSVCKLRPRVNVGGARGIICETDWANL